MHKCIFYGECILVGMKKPAPDGLDWHCFRLGMAGHPIHAAMNLMIVVKLNRNSFSGLFAFKGAGDDCVPIYRQNGYCQVFKHAFNPV